jgi:type II secretory pathway pseudopilin PulG
MKNLKKSSFSLLELIIAIIVVGIAITSIPMLLKTTTNNQALNLEEKSFFSAFSLLNLIQTQEWDENNTKDDNYYKVLTSNDGDTELKCTRLGVLELNNSSGANCDDNTTSHIGLDDGEDKDDVTTYDDIDDFDGYSTIINNFKFNVHVRYMNDNSDYSAKNIFFNENSSSINNSNLKFLEINITDKSNNKLIAVLKYTASNIGMTKIESRSE